MTTSLKKAYLILPFIYLSVCIMFLIFHFTNTVSADEKHTTFYLNWEEINKADGKTDKIDSIELIKDDFHFIFSNNSPLVLIDNNAIESKTFPISSSVKDSVYSLFFDNDAALNFAVKESGSQALAISLHIPEGLDFTYAEIPLSSSSEIAFDEIIPAVYSFNNEGISFLNIGKGSEYSGNGSLKIKTAAVMQFTALPKDADLIKQSFFGDRAAPSDSFYNSQVKKFLDSVYKGLSGDRYSSSRSNWRLPKFDEKSLITMTAESLKRNRYSKDDSDLEAAFKKNSRYTSLASAYYHGDIIKKYDKYKDSSKSKAKSYSKKLKEKNLSVFDTSELLEVMLFEKDSDLNELVFNLLKSSFSNYKPDMQSLINILDIYLNADNLEGSSQNDLMKYRALVDTYIFENIYAVNGRLYFSENGISELSIHLGSTLITIGKAESNSLYTSIGRDLIINIISRADSKGILPAKVSISGKEEGELIPELVYKYLNVDFMPGKSAKDGITVFSISDNVSISKSKEKLEVKLMYHKKGIHHFVIEGVEKIKSVKLYGRNWNEYKRFQNYSEGGWYYNEDEKILYVKIEHKATRESVVVYFETEPETEGTDTESN